MGPRNVNLQNKNMKEGPDAKRTHADVVDEMVGGGVGLVLAVKCVTRE